MTDRTRETFNPGVRCPRCGQPKLLGFLYVDEQGQHMHTHYVCTFWPSSKDLWDAGVPVLPQYSRPRCGWHGWSVPAETPDEAVQPSEISPESPANDSGAASSGPAPEPTTGRDCDCACCSHEYCDNASFCINQFGRGRAQGWREAREGIAAIFRSIQHSASADVARDWRHADEAR